MIAHVMGYMAAVSALLAGGAAAAEYAAASARLPRRWVWLSAIVLSFAWPIAGALAPHGNPAPVSVYSAPVKVETPAAVAGRAETPAAERVSLPAPAGPGTFDLNAILGYGWLLSSLGAWAFYCAGSVRLLHMARTWRDAVVDGVPVRISDHVGPASVGMLRPRIVVPRWLIDADGETRALALAHERSHIATRDPLLVMTALLLIALAPWNPILWWLLRRLRFAIEVDCDARVLGQGTSVSRYGEMLLAVCGRQASIAMGAIALIEPASQLEKRVRAMTAGAKRHVRLAFVAATTTLFGIGAVGAQLTAPRLAIGAAASGQGLSADSAMGGSVDGRRLPSDTGVSVANWMAGVVDGRDVPGDWPRAIWITVDGFARVMTPIAEDEAPFDWIGHALQGDHITFQKNLKYYYIDDPDTVRRAGALMEVDPQDALKDKASAEATAIYFKNAFQDDSPLAKLRTQLGAVRLQMETASSAEVHADLVRKEGDIARQITVMERQLDDQVRHIPNYEKNWAKPFRLPSPAIGIPRYERIRDLIDGAIAAGLAKSADALDYRPFQPPREGAGRPAVILVSGHTLTSDSIAKESDFVSAWRLRNEIKGDYLWYHSRFRSHYVTDAATVAQVADLLPSPGTRKDVQDRIDYVHARFQAAGLERFAMQAKLDDQRAALADRDDRIRAEIAVAGSPMARDRLAKEDADVLAQQETVGAEINELKGPPVALTNAMARIEPSGHYRKEIRDVLTAAYARGLTVPADR